jgi:Xaa-Pro aminopeptidase
MRGAMRKAFLAVIAVVSLCYAAAAGELQDDLKGRRARLMERLGPESLLIVWGVPNGENLYYLTGFTQEDSILVLMPGNAKRKEVLFIRGFDARREHREGHSLTPKEATDLTGIETVLTLEQFEPFVSNIFSRRPFSQEIEAEEFATFFEALDENRARLALVLGRRTLSGPTTPPQEFAAKLRERFDGFTMRDATDAINGLRQIKTAYEQAIMRRSLKISSDAHMAAMRAVGPTRYEYEVESALEAVYLKNGAMRPGYDSIVGSGPNATILHYSESSRQMEAGDLLLVDAAGSFQGYTGDITRTYPVDGSFSREQRDIYEIVLAAQEAGIKVAKAGNRTDDIRAACAEVIRAGLLKLGLLTDAGGDQYRVWYTHGPTHWLGLNVHDVGTTEVLAPGMAFVIEPGIYIREQALDALPKTPENLAFIEKVRPAVKKYLNLGVRIEDSFLLTESGLERLSAAVPRTIDEIESFMRTTRSSAQIRREGNSNRRGAKARRNAEGF